MTTTSDNTAILLFSRSANAENEQKRVFGSHLKFLNKRLLSTLCDDVRKELHKSNLPIFWVDENQQVGADFGERLANAFRSVYEKGYANVIAVGGDVVNLASDDLLQAKSQLEDGNTVLGPSLDGGDYLIGLSKNSFEQLDFQSFRWQSAHLHQQFYNACVNSGDMVYQLRQLMDVDDQTDFFLALKDNLISQNFVDFLTTKLRDSFYFTNTPFLKKHLVSHQGLRAPPLAA